MLQLGRRKFGEIPNKKKPWHTLKVKTIWILNESRSSHVKISFS